MDRIFHLAIPCRDLDEAERFYVDRLGCRMARRYDDRVTLDFFGHQVVCHLDPQRIDPEPRLYPRHFGITLRERAAFDALLASLKERGVAFLSEPFVRFEGQREEHRTFQLADPSHDAHASRSGRTPVSLRC